MAEQTLRCKVHIENKGWTEWLQEGQYAGTTGESLRLEAIVIEGVDEYRVHIENQGWSEWVKEGQVAGTTGKGLRIEAIEIKGKDINYRVHVQNTGWLNWAVSGEMAGSTGYGLRVEAIQLILNNEPLQAEDKRKSFVAPAKPVPVPNKPSVKLSGIRFLIDAGHGGSDSGAVGTMYEKDMNLEVALKLEQALKKEGATVFQTRTTDKHLYLSERTTMANNLKVDIFLSIHHNGSNNPSSHGSEVICHFNSQQGFKLATLILQGLTNRLGTYKRRVIQRDDFTVTYTDMPAVITEALFVTNPNEVHKFKNGGAELEVLGIMDGILAYFA